jgi:hypothetical protein
MGSSRYSSYIEKCRENFEKNSISQLALSSKPIFDDMYNQLKEENKARIAERMRDLLDTLSTAFRITQYFIFVILAYVLANVVILALDLDYYVTCVSIALMGVCFLYKLVEFVSNKYCVLDAYLIMIYKSVLEKRAKEN